MKRTYTDDQFPGYEIVNHGRTIFEVFLNGKLVSRFESWELPDGTVTEAFAGRRAVDFFNRLRVVPLEEVNMQRKVWKGRVPLPESPETKHRMTSNYIDQLMAKEKMESVPERKQALRRQILDLMQQEETLAEAVVNHLVASR